MKHFDKTRRAISNCDASLRDISFRLNLLRARAEEAAYSKSGTPMKSQKPKLRDLSEEFIKQATALHNACLELDEQ